MRVSILTLNPGFFGGALDEGMIRVAREKGLLEVVLVPIRAFADDRYGTTDDYPYGGGAGMVMKAAPIVAAHESVARSCGGAAPRTLVTSPQGRVLTQEWVRELAAEKHLAVVCGRYKGIDERVVATLGAEEFSIGDYVLSGGEPAALVLTDAVSRLQPGVLGDAESAEADSFSEALLDAPVYTRPDEFRGRSVPEVLRSGNHEEIRRWRRREAIRRTLARRPDIVRGRAWSEEDRRLMDEIKREADQP
ncbi:MAG TPA: tRNA (guanosine(37)-N1)-methyltransferase TrmD [Candidatus Binatia bacterium]|nr:tRNA (guanosine(37)-N1)-methyltransferase TrmD [Candidatus Binatia bacterium]